MAGGHYLKPRPRPKPSSDWAGLAWVGAASFLLSFGFSGLITGLFSRMALAAYGVSAPLGWLFALQVGACVAGIAVVIWIAVRP